MDHTFGLPNPLSHDVLIALRCIPPSHQSQEKAEQEEEKYHGRAPRSSFQPALLHRQDSPVGVRHLPGGPGEHQLQLRHLVEEHLHGGGDEEHLH